MRLRFPRTKNPIKILLGLVALNIEICIILSIITPFTMEGEAIWIRILAGVGLLVFGIICAGIYSAYWPNG